MSDTERKIDEIIAELTRKAAINNDTNGKDMIKAMSKGVFVDEKIRNEARAKLHDLMVRERVAGMQEATKRREV